MGMGELQLGERLLLADGGEGVVESVQTENALLSGHGSLGTPTNDNGLFSVYNFKVHDWHTYHVAASVDQPFVFVHNAPCAIYGELDHLGRPTGVSVEITQDMIGTGSSASRRIRPPGFKGGASNQARGHLWGKQLGGSGSEVRNLVTIQQNPANTPFMRDFETLVRQAVENGETVQYRVVPIYEGENLVPRGVTIHANGSKGFSLDLTVLNPAAK
ncbi:MAG: DNA/RNA non-specific endonuclease [Planctomycetota bacterium]